MFNIDCLYLLNIYFDDVYIYNNNSVSDSVTTYIFIICKNFKGLPKKDFNKYSKLIDTVYNYDNTGGSKFNILDKKNREKYSVLKKITDKDIKYLVRIFNNKIRNSVKYKNIYNMCKKYNDKLYYKLNIYYNKFIKYTKEILLNNNKKVIQKLKKKQLLHSIQYAQKYDLKINPVISVEKTKKEIFNEFMKNINKPIEYVNYKVNFPTKRIIFTKTFMEEKPEKIREVDNRLELNWSIRDTRDNEYVGHYTYHIKYFHKNFQYFLSERFHTHGITQAGIKLYEILMTHDNIVDKKAKTFNTFHLCELPGSFLYSLDLYINNNRTNIKKWNWMSQSLVEGVNKGFSNKYKLTEKFPKNWDFGKTGSGNITDIKNMKYYSEHKDLQNANLVTSDCGLSLDEPKELVNKLFFASILIILSGSKKGSNYIQKIYTPFNHLFISLIYVCANYYENFYLYKPIVNPVSPEIYLVFENFKGITKKKKEKLFDMYKTFIKITDKEKYESFSIVKNIPEDFSEEFAKGLNLYADKLIDVIQNGINISDFFTLNDKDDNKNNKNNKNLENYKEIFYKKIKENRLQKRKDWIKMFDFKNSKKSYLQ